jgi:hypothetical protein
MFRSDDRGADQYRENSENIPSMVPREVCAKCNRYGDGTGADGQRHGQGIEGASEFILRRNIFLNSAIAAASLLFRAIQHGPARGNHDKASANLYDRQRDVKKSKNVSAHQARTDEKEKTVYGDTPRKGTASGGGIVRGQSEKDRAAAKRIDDREKRAEDQERAFCAF